MVKIAGRAQFEGTRHVNPDDIAADRDLATAFSEESHGVQHSSVTLHSWKFSHAEPLIEPLVVERKYVHGVWVVWDAADASVWQRPPKLARFFGLGPTQGMASGSDQKPAAPDTQTQSQAKQEAQPECQTQSPPGSHDAALAATPIPARQNDQQERPLEDQPDDQLCLVPVLNEQGHPSQERLTQPMSEIQTPRLPDQEGVAQFSPSAAHDAQEQGEPLALALRETPRQKAPLGGGKPNDQSSSRAPHLEHALNAVRTPILVRMTLGTLWTPLVSVRRNAGCCCCHTCGT